MSKTYNFSETLVDYISTSIKHSTIGFATNNKLWLNGGSGPGGGSGGPPGGIVGQLIQRRVAYDTTESGRMCIEPSGSLLDNLNRIRWWQKPARWFEASPQSPRSMKVEIGEGIWYYDENLFLDFPGGESPTITLPTVNPRLDVVYVTESGVIGIQEGAEAADPVITMPTASGVLPIWAIYVTPTTAQIGWPCESYSGYLHEDIRPFIAYPGGGGGVVDANYVVMGLDPTLTDERVLTAGVGISITDGGAGGNVVIAVVASGIDHGGLSGLADDDHPQYLLVDGTRPMDSGANLLPTDAVGQELGAAGTRWDMFARNIDMADGGWIGNAVDDLRIIFLESDSIEIRTDDANLYTFNENPSVATPMSATAAVINITGGDNTTGQDAGLWLRNEETNTDWSLFIDKSDYDHFKIARNATIVAEFNTVGNFIMLSGNDIDPEDASGQDLGSSAHRWDLYATDINMDNGGTIHCTTLGGPVITFNSITDLLGFTECRVSIGHNVPIVALDIDHPNINYNGILLASGTPVGVLGMIKFTGLDFFGYTPSGWMSLTASGAGGGGVSLWDDLGTELTPRGNENVQVADGKWIGCDVNNSWLFDSSNGDITTQANVGIGLVALDEALQLYTAASTAKFFRTEWGTIGECLALGGDSTIGPYLLSHTDSSGDSTCNVAAARWKAGAGGHQFATSAVTAIGVARTWVDRMELALNGDLFLYNPNVAHGMTDIAPTSAYARFAVVSVDYGGIRFWGLSDDDAVGLQFTGVIGSADPTDTVAALIFTAGKKNGISWQALAAAETAFGFDVDADGTNEIVMLGSGNVGFGTLTPNARVTIADDANIPPLSVAERGAAPAVPAANDVYLDDGTNTGSGDPGWRRYTGAAWEDISAGAGGAGYWARDVGNGYTYTSNIGDRVGIGTITPDAFLEVVSSTVVQLRLTHTDNTDYVTFAVDGDGQLDITTVDGGGAGGHICLLPDGNVGIGAAAPGLKLDVVGSPGGPATSGAVQTGIARFQATGYPCLDHGVFSTGSYGLWLQGTLPANLAATYPIILNPNGGHIGIGTAAPASVANASAIAVHAYQNSTNGACFRAQSSNASVELYAGNAAHYLYSSTNTSLYFYLNSAHRFTMSPAGHFYPASNKTQSLGLTGNRWQTIYSSNALSTGTSRLIDAIKLCPVCGQQMVRGTGGLCVVGEEEDYMLAFCPDCGVAAMEPIKHVTETHLAKRRKPPKVELVGVTVVPSSGLSRQVFVNFRYKNGSGEPDDGDLLNSTLLGETEIEEFFALEPQARKEFLLQLGIREWEATEEVRLMSGVIKRDQALFDTAVSDWIGTDLL